MWPGTFPTNTQSNQAQERRWYVCLSNCLFLYHLGGYIVGMIVDRHVTHSVAGSPNPPPPWMTHSGGSSTAHGKTITMGLEVSIDWSVRLAAVSCNIYLLWSFCINLEYFFSTSYHLAGKSVGYQRKPFHNCRGHSHRGKITWLCPVQAWSACM